MYVWYVKPLRWIHMQVWTKELNERKMHDSLCFFIWELWHSMYQSLGIWQHNISRAHVMHEVLALIYPNTMFE
ncbi:unnamed protein product [Sphenostylis stenocarpa]|uniref:Uncharacterized protein n=1 Tax=Sphenostylis stenocarpa TaxID=92480 RepID=A0AA86RU87_9FABA|nr:unnamed protein product [Sphenostylis stenocarpa]